MHQQAKPAVPAKSGPLSPASGDTAFIPIRLCNLPPFHPVAAKLLALSADDALDVTQTTSLVGGDPALAAEIMFVANSSLFGFPMRIESLRHAVAVLGGDCIRQLAMTVAVRDLAHGVGPYVRACWHHSIACAEAARTIAPFFGCNREQAYTAGLLHDVGRLGFLRTYSSEIGRVMSREYAGPGQLNDAEAETMQATHQEAGAWLIEYWALPQSFSETCAHHHDDFAQGDSALLHVVKTACRLADAIGFSAVRYVFPDGYQQVLKASGPSIPSRYFPDETELNARIQANLAAFR